MLQQGYQTLRQEKLRSWLTYFKAAFNNRKCSNLVPRLFKIHQLMNVSGSLFFLQTYIIERYIAFKVWQTTAYNQSLAVITAVMC